MNYFHVCYDGMIKFYPSVLCSRYPHKIGDNCDFTAEEFVEKLNRVYGPKFSYVWKVQKEKPKHGPCCTCQTCGFGYDECMCEQNNHTLSYAVIRGLLRRIEQLETMLEEKKE